MPHNKNHHNNITPVVGVVGGSTVIYSNGCLSKGAIINGGGKINENDDGTVSVFVKTPTGLDPLILTKPCCEVLDSRYVFDVDNQECRWSAPCDELNAFKVVLNPKGNDGVIFPIDVNSNESCELNISFDFLLQIDCEEMMNTVTTNSNNNGVDPATNARINTLKLNRSQIVSQLNANNTNLTKLEADLTSTPFVIVCSTSQFTTFSSTPTTTPTKPTLNTITPNFGAPLGISGIGTQSTNYGTTTYCLTDLGLTEWATILGTNKFNTWLDSDGTDTSVYDCNDVNTLVATDNNTGTYLGTCNVGLTTRKSISTNIDNLQNTILNLNNALVSINALIAALESTFALACSTVTNILETMNICMTLERINPITGKLETVHEESIFNIGVGNLVSYLQGTIPNTGLYAPCTTSQIYCDQMGKSLMTEIAQQATQLNNQEIQELVEDSFDSSWLNFATNITDPTVLNLIANEKIKISFTIKDCCADFAILVDRIKLDRNCSQVETSTVQITKSPSFNMLRVCDNKKSWITKESFEDRDFDLKLRETSYDINDFRLAINSKEVDLDINPANAIENDVWCYLTDNESLLDCSTGSTETIIDTSVDFQEILNTQYSGCGLNTVCNINEVFSVWALDVDLVCVTTDNLYTNNVFFSGVTGSTPTEVDYQNELINVANTLGLDYEINGSEFKLIQNNVCDTNYINKELRINLGLVVSCASIEQKQFQNGDPFDFQDGTPYQFN